MESDGTPLPSVTKIDETAVARPWTVFAPFEYKRFEAEYVSAKVAVLPMKLVPFPLRILPVVAALAIRNPVPALTTPDVTFVSPAETPVVKYPPPVTESAA